MFQSSDDKPDSLTTVSIMHDLSSNIIFTTIKPTVDTLTQSFDAEGQNPDMYQLPEYFFEGFPETMSLEITSDSSVTLLGNVDDRSGVLTIGSPLFAKSHDMTIDYFGGRPYAIRGDVNVKKDGSHKTITEIDFETSFRPLSITTILKSANRDTLVFHADSVPDTLKAKTSYRSFYAPVTIIEKIEDGSTFEAETDTPVEEESVEQEVDAPETPAEVETQTDEPAQEAEDPPVSTTEQDSNITENPSPEDPLDQIENLPAEAQPDSTGS